VEREEDFLWSQYLVGDNDREPLDARSSARRVKGLCMTSLSVQTRSAFDRPWLSVCVNMLSY